MERTFIAVKPDGVQRGLCGEIIKRFEHRGFRLVAAKFVQVKTTPGATTHIQTTDQHILTTSRGRFFSAAVHLFIKVQLSALNWGFDQLHQNRVPFIIILLYLTPSLVAAAHHLCLKAPPPLRQLSWLAKLDLSSRWVGLLCSLYDIIQIPD